MNEFCHFSFNLSSFHPFLLLSFVMLVPVVMCQWVVLTEKIVFTSVILTKKCHLLFTSQVNLMARLLASLSLSLFLSYDLLTGRTQFLAIPWSWWLTHWLLCKWHSSFPLPFVCESFYVFLSLRLHVLISLCVCVCVFVSFFFSPRLGCQLLHYWGEDGNRRQWVRKGFLLTQWIKKKHMRQLRWGIKHVNGRQAISCTVTLLASSKKGATKSTARYKKKWLSEMRPLLLKDQFELGVLFSASLFPYSAFAFVSVYVCVYVCVSPFSPTTIHEKPPMQSPNLLYFPFSLSPSLSLSSCILYHLLPSFVVARIIPKATWTNIYCVTPIRIIQVERNDRFFFLLLLLPFPSSTRP